MEACYECTALIHLCLYMYVLENGFGEVVKNPSLLHVLAKITVEVIIICSVGGNRNNIILTTMMGHLVLAVSYPKEDGSAVEYGVGLLVAE